MRKIKLIKIEPRNAFLNSWSDSEPYILTYEKERWLFLDNKIIKKEINVPDHKVVNWNMEMQNKVGVWEAPTEAKDKEMYSLILFFLLFLVLNALMLPFIEVSTIFGLVLKYTFIPFTALVGTGTVFACVKTLKKDIKDGTLWG